VSEFLTESVEVLERLANATEPPMELAAIKGKRHEFKEVKEVKEPLLETMAEMEKAFQGFGQLDDWDFEVLMEIDKCFVESYMENDEPAPYLFIPDNMENLNAFTKYCDDVDQVLRTNSDKVPKYAREYFAYYTIWEMRGYGFPVPLGTRSVVLCLDKILGTVPRGLTEVSLVIIEDELGRKRGGLFLVARPAATIF
jgi:hypothetical protein